MRVHNDDPQSSDEQHADTDGCPTCGGDIQAIERRGPGEVVVSPCGDVITETLARDFPRASRARADGGSELVCDGCGLSSEDVREVETVDPKGRVAVCDECETDLNARIVEEVPR